MGKIKPKCHFGLQKVRVHDLVRGESQEQEEEKEEEGRGEEDQGMESLFLGFDLNPKVLGMEISSPLVLVLCKEHMNL